MHWQLLTRRLLRAPVFTIITVLTLAIGIGANTAIFSVVEGVLLKPLPFSHPESVIAVDHTAPGVGIAHAGAAPFLYFTYKERAQTLADVAMWRGGSSSVTGLPEPEEVPELDVTWRFLPLLGVQPTVGRGFTERDDSPGSPLTVVLTYGYWQRRFGGQASAIGRTILLDGRPREIIGVLPQSFHFLDQEPALLLPLGLDRAKTFLGDFSYQAIGRLKPGVTPAQANAEASRLVPVALDTFPTFRGFSRQLFQSAALAPVFVPLKELFIGDIGKVLWVLMGTIGMVLLIACANVANLLLVRAEGRQHELAIRAALGAGWSRIARELLLESVTLAVLGGIAGLGVAFGALRLLVALAPAQLPRLHEISIDVPVLAFAFGISIIAGLLFGIMPVVKYAGPGVAGALRAGGRSLSLSRERHRARNILVVVQVALALVLLVGSGLMIRTFQALKNVQPGFTRPAELLTLRISIPQSQVQDPVLAIRTEQNILDRVAAIPGVSSVALVNQITMTGEGWHDPVFAEDHPVQDAKLPVLRSFKTVSPGWAQTMGNGLIAGRDFTWTDLYEKRPVAMVSESLAREMWGSPAAALGKRIHESLVNPWREIVGVVGDVRENGVNHRAPSLAIWPLLMDNFEGNTVYVQRGVNVVVRSGRTGTSGFVDEVSRAVWSVNANLPVANVRTMEEIYNRSMARTSFTLVMLAIAGAMALVLGVVGLYGVISYTVTQRTREIGIRLALGARHRSVTGMFVGQGLRLAAVGVGCGLAAAFALMRLLTSLLFEVSPADPVTYVAVAGCLVLAAMFASYVPALRASGVDPVEALRAE